MNLLGAFLLFCVAQALAWLQISSDHVPYLRRLHWLVIVGLVGSLAGIGFRLATAAVMDATEDAWTARILAFAAGQVVFAFMTWQFLGQGIDGRAAIALFLTAGAILVKIL